MYLKEESFVYLEKIVILIYSCLYNKRISHLNGPISTDSFQNPQILKTISSGHDIIHTPASFPVWGFIMTMVIVISFARERKTAPNDFAPELKRLE